MDGQFILQLFGHVHMPFYTPDEETIGITCVALQPHENMDDIENKYQPLYNILELSIRKQEHKEMLHVDVTAMGWNKNMCKFEEDGENSKSFDVVMNNIRKSADKKPTLPENVTLRKIKMAYLDRSSRNVTINKIFKDFYESDRSVSYNDAKFMKEVKTQNKWAELWSLLNA